MSSRGSYPVGSDTIEVLTDGETMTALCTVCDPPVVIGTWTEFVMLNDLLHALFTHQAHVQKPTRGALAIRQCVNPDCLAEEGERHHVDCMPERTS